MIHSNGLKEGCPGCFAIRLSWIGEGICEDGGNRLTFLEQCQCQNCLLPYSSIRVIHITGNNVHSFAAFKHPEQTEDLSLYFIVFRTIECRSPGIDRGVICSCIANGRHAIGLVIHFHGIHQQGDAFLNGIVPSCSDQGGTLKVHLFRSRTLFIYVFANFQT